MVGLVCCQSVAIDTPAVLQLYSAPAAVCYAALRAAVLVCCMGQEPSRSMSSTFVGEPDTSKY
jgi:hypothetical protein